MAGCAIHLRSLPLPLLIYPVSDDEGSVRLNLVLKRLLEERRGSWRRWTR